MAVRRSVRSPVPPWTAPSLDAPDPSPVERRVGSTQAALRLARNIRGQSDSELVFHLFLSHLHEVGKLDDTNVSLAI